MAQEWIVSWFYILCSFQDKTLLSHGTPIVESLSAEAQTAGKEYTCGNTSVLFVTTYSYVVSSFITLASYRGDQ